MIIERSDDKNDRVVLSLDENDVEQAIRHYVCTSFPRLSKGYVIDVTNTNIPKKIFVSAKRGTRTALNKQDVCRLDL